MKIEALIIDDEESGRSVLQKLLLKFCPDVEVVGTAGSVSDGYTLWQQKKPDLVFLDIQMPTGNGFKLLEKFKGQVPFGVIFVTGFDQYAINAIKFSALDYLLKPVEVSQLKSAVARAIKVIKDKENNNVQIVNLLNNVDPSAAEKKISVHNNDKVLVINLSEIAYIEADDRYCSLTTIKGEQHVITKTLKEFEEFFAECPLLIRISKSIILNVNSIKAYSKEEPYTIEMKDSKMFEISRRKRQEVLESIKNK
jgi:two-component system LytT family response regulator